MLKAHLGHMALFANDPVHLAEFYQNLFGMEMVGKSSNNSSVFIGGGSVNENHELAFIHNPKAAHIGLKVDSPEDLLAYYQEIKARGLQIIAVWNHGATLGMYIPDPEGNVVEIYWNTGREDYQPPYFGPLDLEDQTQESLRKLVAEMPSQHASPEKSLEQALSSLEEK
ncbi:hypothetical protein KDA_52610 [Dictyobacter alpinus]|uniref:VOC domain-containing protein n=1 Tax=Dictyobacter alpinus TaxID=2014873 RepID=A0A402BET8_9CHLR|nr:VOC family protein [Dictyobacter alpinus]GCE29777.1 hypothetical protein KDA_52610 [Dictyobacter alpinus]